MACDHTHDAARRSWVASANDGVTDFPVQNLPLGVFETDGGRPTCGVAIGDQVLDLRLAAERGLIRDPAAGSVREDNLDALFALGRGPMRLLRHDVFDLLAEGADRPDPGLLRPASSVSMRLPTSIRGFTDFFAGVHHAVRCGEIAGQADNPLPASYHYQPIAYNGRASTVRVSGAEVRRPSGLRRPFGATDPSFGPSLWFDFELEMGFFIGAGNTIGEPVAIADAAERIVGFCLLNDWSARDIQLFEMAPLGPFNAKSVATSISPWVVTAEALEPFRTPAMARLPGAPPLSDYLRDDADQRSGGLDVTLTATIMTARMRAAGDAPVRLVETHARHLYWTFAQMVAHQTVNGCALVPGDLTGTGTISAPGEGGYASLLEISAAGRMPIELPNGEIRSFLEDGDTITLGGRCERPGRTTIGFGVCEGRVVRAGPFDAAESHS